MSVQGEIEGDGDGDRRLNVCARWRKTQPDTETVTETKAETVVGGRLMEELLSTTLRASVSQTESCSEIS